MSFRKKRPFLLVTNDDGIEAPGLRHLYQILSEVADIQVVAPRGEQSGVGLAITMRKPLHIKKEVNWQSQTTAWSITGTPADCVKMGVSVLLEKKPDLIISGINKGSNAGRNVLYSGTVGGVIEGVFQGIPGIAFSCEDFDTPDFSRTKKYVQAIVKNIFHSPLPQGTLLNVNFPSNEHKEILGLRLTRQGKSYWMENPDERQHPEGNTYYWLGGRYAHFSEDEESDVSFLKKGYATAVPIHVGELTDHDHLEDRKQTFSQLV